jgi:hypothetical protein
MNWQEKCVICHQDIEPQRDKDGHIYWHGGHNPSPVADDGYCCSHCNDTIVTPSRVTEMIIELNGGKNG